VVQACVTMVQITRTSIPGKVTGVTLRGGAVAEESRTAIGGWEGGAGCVKIKRVYGM
jgi:hypothetical protein